jgi:hypothetical protein
MVPLPVISFKPNTPAHLSEASLPIGNGSAGQRLRRNRSSPDRRSFDIIPSC